MDEKYKGKTIVLPKHTSATLIQVQEHIHKELGFKPSLSECVTFLAKYWLERDGGGHIGQS